MKLLTAKYGSKCNATGQLINKGELMYYDYSERKVYCKSYIDNEREAVNTKAYIQAQEDAYFDRFISLNYNHEN